MKLDFKFSNLCGTVYKKGNVVFTPDGNSIISPVGNRVTVFDLVNNKSHTLPFENKKDIHRLALSPNGALLITVDEDGRAVLVNFPRRVVLHHHNFKSEVHDLQFSPNGRYLAVSHQKQVHIWRTPGFTRDFAPFVLHRKLPGHYDDVVHLSWSSDSRFLVTGSKDMTARVYSMEEVEGFEGAVLTGHRDTVVGAWFSKDNQTIYSVGKDGALFVWNLEEKIRRDAEMNDGGGKKRRKGVDGQEIRTISKWLASEKHYFNQSAAKVTCVSFHAPSNLLVVGFNSGIFGIWELPDFNNIHTLSISQKKITSAAINATGEWLAFGSSALGQLLVWEWQSESYILKQQGHQHDMTCLTYSQDGQFIATGGDDGKVKLWNTTSGFCFVTFTEHSGGVAAIEFAKQGQVVFSASLDGTVRAFDLVRYRNFRTFTTPTPVQFSCLAVDPSGDVVVAGSMDTFEVFVWSVQTGKLLDIMAGHEAPISGLAFSPTEGMVASGSWDKTVRVWDVFGRDKAPESFEHQSEVLSVAWRPDGKQFASTTLDGQVSFWDMSFGKLTTTIEGRRDIAGGRKATDRMTAKNSQSNKHFTSICYTADGSTVLAGGNSKYVCIYDIPSKSMLKRFQISANLSLDGMQDILNSKNMTEAGPKDLIDTAGENSDLEDRIDSSLPGVKSGDASLRKTRPEVRTKAVRFAPTGRSWAAASTEGLLIYSLDETLTFDPFDLEIDITPETVLEALISKEYLRSLVMSFRLGEKNITQKVYDSIPVESVSLVVRDVPQKYLDRLMGLLVAAIEGSPRIEFHLVWVTGLMKFHGKWLRERYGEVGSAVRALQKGLGKMYEDVSKVCDDNTYTLNFLLSSMEKNQMEEETPMEIEAVGMDIVGL
ncbi:hypothetical protein HK097_007965 [Rhizophlyctis rosea]|uniref:Small-subunit processome Utp12 domain-containing protein n=1 Tax=Rhizophlyctis rosea TaxID=64517 RepID=A0AAD5SLI1_9FUNG|nr:hypothetical protein HK097_007965 [Rhizophlyctis rosea]